MSKEQYVESLLLKEILTEQVTPGTLLLPERDLAIKYSCSRPVVHKAIIRLENKGLLRIRPRKGIEVLDFKTSGKLSLMEVITAMNKEGIAHSFNEDMLEFIKDNLRNVIRRFEHVKKKPTPINLTKREGFFDLIIDYSVQCGNHVYVMLMNEFKTGILNVASQCIDKESIHRMFLEIESLIIIGKIEKAIKILEPLFDEIKDAWIGGQ